MIRTKEQFTKEIIINVFFFSVFFTINNADAMLTRSGEGRCVDVVISRIRGLNTKSLEVSLYRVHGDEAERSESEIIY